MYVTLFRVLQRDKCVIDTIHTYKEVNSIHITLVIEMNEKKNATVLPDNRWNQKKKSFCDPYFFLDLIAVSFFNKKLGFMIDFVPQMSSPGSRVGEGTW